jgi:hypothetical protein
VGGDRARLVAEAADEWGLTLGEPFEDLLTTKLQRLSVYVDAVATNESIGANTGAGVSDLSIATSIVADRHATVQGRYSVWVSGQHRENGELKDDRSTASYSFAAGLDLIQGRWLVSSWDDQELS